MAIHAPDTEIESLCGLSVGDYIFFHESLVEYEVIATGIHEPLVHGTARTRSRVTVIETRNTLAQDPRYVIYEDGFGDLRRLRVDAYPPELGHVGSKMRLYYAGTIS